MKVKDLIEILKTHDKDREIIMSKDSEGNNYSPLASIFTGSYQAQTTWYGHVGLEQKDLTDELRKKGYSEDDVVDGIQALILKPIN